MASIKRNQLHVEARFIGIFTEDKADGPLPTWKVFATKGSTKRFIGYIHKVAVTRPVKANTYVSHDKNHIRLGSSSYTLRGAIKKYEGK